MKPILHTWHAFSLSACVNSGVVHSSQRFLTSIGWIPSICRGRASILYSSILPEWDSWKPALCAVMAGPTSMTHCSGPHLAGLGESRPKSSGGPSPNMMWDDFVKWKECSWTQLRPCDLVGADLTLLPLLWLLSGLVCPAPKHCTWFYTMKNISWIPHENYVWNTSHWVKSVWATARREEPPHLYYMKIWLLSDHASQKAPLRLVDRWQSLSTTPADELLKAKLLCWLPDSIKLSLTVKRIPTVIVFRWIWIWNHDI